MGLVMAMIVGAAPAVAHPPPGVRQLTYQTDFDPVTVAVPADPVPADPVPFATDSRFLPAGLPEASMDAPRARSPLRIRGKGVRVRLRIPI